MSPAGHATADWRNHIERYHGVALNGNLILESWKRSEQIGVDPNARAKFRRVADEDLAARLEKNSRLLEIVVPHLTWVSASFCDVTHAAYVTDADGIVLHSCGDAGIIDEAGLLPGFDWSESAMGTNGAGTALAARSLVAVVGCDHWVSQWHSATCLAAPICDATGRPVAALDVTVAGAEGRPERLVTVAHAAYAIEQQLLRREAESAHAANAELMAIAAHEMRQPLNAAEAALWVASRIPDESSRVQSIDLATRQLRQMKRLIDDLSSAVGTASSPELTPLTPVDVSEVIALAMETVRTSAEDKNIQLLVSRPSSGVTVDGDPGRLQQVFVNILSNSVKYSERGGRVDIEFAPSNDSVSVSVRDSGCGIAAEDLHQVFQLFERGHRRGTHTGLGIGLTVAHRIVEEHGGTISISSAGENSGTEVVVTLPTRHSD